MIIMGVLGRVYFLIKRHVDEIALEQPYVHKNKVRKKRHFMSFIMKLKQHG